MNEYLGPIQESGQAQFDSYQHLHVEPLNGALGGVITNIQIGDTMDKECFAELQTALVNHLVLFFPQQKNSPFQLLNFAKKFGELHINPFGSGHPDHEEIMLIQSEENHRLRFAEKWHTDISWDARPSMGSILQAKVIPPFGGDTLFANMYLAYEHLSDELKHELEGKRALHTSYRNHNSTPQFGEKPPSFVSHPVIRTHPVSGRKLLYVNDYFTLCFEGESETQSAPLLNTLFRHLSRPDFCCRFRWHQNAIAFWDNRCTQHYATNDYAGYQRLMHRVTINGDIPV